MFIFKVGHFDLVQCPTLSDSEHILIIRNMGADIGYNYLFGYQK